VKRSSPARGRRESHPKWRFDELLVLVALVLVAFNLRAPFAVVGPLLGELQTQVGLGPTAGAALASIPLVCFGVLAPLAPAVAKRLGMHGAVLVALAVLLLGISIRAIGISGLYVGTVFIGLGIAVMNVLLPAIVRSELARRIGLATGVVTCATMLSATVAAAAAQPLTSLVGGKAVPSLAFWACPALTALLMWMWVFSRRARTVPSGQEAPRGVFVLLHDPVALAVTIFFGLQSVLFYSILAWLPRLLVESGGMTDTDSGVALAVACAVGVPVGVIVPKIAAGMSNQRLLVPLLALPSAFGILGLLVAPSAAPWVWSLLLGLGNGCSFPLAMTFIVLRSRDQHQTARLSAAAQGVGYCVGSLGPLSIGALMQATQSWTYPLVLLALVLGFQIYYGMRAGGPTRVAVP
jgi:CP family cyanate transporter-like MFS transporter